MVIFNEPSSHVATIAQQPSHFSTDVVMVYVQAAYPRPSTGIRRSFTHGARSALLLLQRSVFRRRYPVHTMQVPFPQSPTGIAFRGHRTDLCTVLLVVFLLSSRVTRAASMGWVLVRGTIPPRVPPRPERCRWQGLNAVRTRTHRGKVRPLQVGPAGGVWFTRPTERQPSSSWRGRPGQRPPRQRPAHPGRRPWRASPPRRPGASGRLRGPP